MSSLRSCLNLLAFAALLPHSSLWAQDSEPQTNSAQERLAPLPLNELRTFAEVLDRIKTAYVEPIDDRTLLENAIKGMLGNLDPHSSYLDAKAFSSLQESTSGEFGGLGIEVSMEEGFIKVVSPIDDTPAARAGIEAGDLIIKLNETPIKGLSLGEAVDQMRGEPGSKIVLTIIRKGGQPFKVEIERAIIKVQSVRSRLLETGYGYLRISQFQVNSGNEVAKALAHLKKSNGGQPLNGLVLDLRNNPGGVLQSAVDVADHFLTKGLIVYTQGRLPNSALSFSADPQDASEQVPLVVLINSGSASAAEIVAGALQDQKRGIIMGTDSFGKGSVQTILPLDNSSALKLTTALYYTPSGRSIQAQGIVPDIEVERAQLVRKANTENEQIREANLLHHLDNANDSGEHSAEDKPHRQPTSQDDDYQLNQALTLLKGLHFTRNNP